MRTLVIASAASATAALVTSRLWIAGTWIAAAMTPVIVTLVSEMLRRPTAALARGITVDRPALPDPEAPARPEAAAAQRVAQRLRRRGRPAARPRGAAPAACAPRPRPPPRACTAARRRARARAGARSPTDVVFGTAALAFVIAVLALTLPELIAGDSIGKNSGRTTLFGGSKKKSQNESGSSTTPAADARRAADRQRPSSRRRRPRADDRPRPRRRRPRRRRPRPPSPLPRRRPRRPRSRSPPRRRRHPEGPRAPPPTYREHELPATAPALPARPAARVRAGRRPTRHLAGRRPRGRRGARRGRPLRCAPGGRRHGPGQVPDARRAGRAHRAAAGSLGRPRGRQRRNLRWAVRRPLQARPDPAGQGLPAAAHVVRRGRRAALRDPPAGRPAGRVGLRRALARRLDAVPDPTALAPQTAPVMPCARTTCARAGCCATRSSIPPSPTSRCGVCPSRAPPVRAGAGSTRSTRAASTRSSTPSTPSGAARSASICRTGWSGRAASGMPRLLVRGERIQVVRRGRVIASESRLPERSTAGGGPPWAAALLAVIGAGVAVGGVRRLRS